MKINEYDEETQATIRKLMFEQRQKRMNSQDMPPIPDIPSNLNIPQIPQGS